MKERERTFGKKGESIALVSLGCAKNIVDLQVRVGNLLKTGCVLSPDPDYADTVIVNTCAFIAAAREEAEAEICRALELKRCGRYRRVVVTGCYPQRYPHLRDAFPGVDEWIGVPSAWVEPKMPAMRLTGKAFAFLKIAEGCSHRCAYCAIPSIRGKFRSRPLPAILREAKALLASGCRELNIVAQDPMLYGVDLPKDGKGNRPHLTDLLWALDRLKGDFWVRVLYSYPSEIDEDFLVWLLNGRHAVRYVDMPIQHTEPEVLKKMGRKSAIEASLTAVDILRECIPDITIRTTVMTGFPGETALRFQRMLADLKRFQFDHLGAFAYSPEQGTLGARLGGRPSRKTAELRERLVMEQQQDIWSHKAARQIGTTQRALVVAPGVARLASQAPEVDGVVRIKGRSPEVGTFANVKLLKADGFDFIASPVTGGSC